MKKLLLRFSLVLALFAFVSCGGDDHGYDPTYDRLIGRTWVGDFGMIAPNGLSVESGITFNSSGFGQDELYYYQEDGGGPAGKLPIRWELYYDTLSVDYGNAAPRRELRNVYVGRSELSGELYIFDNDPRGPYYGHITLFLED